MSSEFDALREKVLAFEFPGGTLHVRPHERFLGHEAAQAEVSGTLLHPMWVMIGGLRGMGVGISDIISLADANADDGVMFGEASIDQHRPLTSGEDYDVSGRCADFVRREGRRAGTFDILTFELYLHDQTSSLVAVSTNSFIFPRE